MEAEMQSSDRTVALILLGVLAVMLWPVWLAAAAAERQFTWTVAATALLPLAFSLLVTAAALRLPSRLAHRYQHGVHTLGERLHAGTHRHA
jgi:sterol desaturase/sphingolipid hydroxylase (fatty acid hydroxylase superfamily)